jgi:hypothetical protein
VVNGKNLGTLKRRQSLKGILHAGRNEIDITITADDSSGGIGGGAELDSTQHPKPLPVEWEISGASTGLSENWFDPKLDETDWHSVAVGGKVSLEDPDSIRPVWIRLHFQVPAVGILRLHLKATGNGFLYLNGRPLGRYWEVGPQRDFYLPECWLNPPGKDNLVTLELRPTRSPVGIGEASVETYP